VAGRQGKNVILSEFCANTGYHRKYAIRLLNGPRPEKRRRDSGAAARAELRSGDVGHSDGGVGSGGLSLVGAVESAVASWMPWIRKRFRVRPEIAEQLLSISARQMDRRLQAQTTQRRRRIYGPTLHRRA